MDQKLRFSISENDFIAFRLITKLKLTEALQGYWNEHMEYHA